MHAQPTSIGLAHKHDGRSSGPLEARPIEMKSGAGPRRDGSRHRPIGACKHGGIFEVEGEPVSSGPYVVPLGLSPRGQAAHKFPIGTKHDDVGMPEGCLLYTSDAADDLLCVDLG